MSHEDLESLIDDIDLNVRYNLRRTRGRREVVSQFLRNPVTMATNNNTTTAANTHTTTTTTTTQSHSSPRQAAWITSKFCGYVPENIPNRDTLMAYDVNRWLCDSETRSLVKGITDDSLRITEAKLAVSSEHGDASRVLNTGRMNTIRDYKLFKEKCLRFWRPISERDRFLTLSQFLSINYDKSFGLFASNLEAARSGILQDLDDDAAFEQGNITYWSNSNRSDVTLVALDDIISYFSWGVIFKCSPPSVREALRKLDLSFSDDFMDILSRVQMEMVKSENRSKVEMSMYASKQTRKSEARNNFRKNPSQNNRNSGSVRCFRCEKLGHQSKNCRVSLVCTSCNKRGHIASKCFGARRQERSNNARDNNTDAGANGNAKNQAPSTSNASQQ